MALARDRFVELYRGLRLLKTGCKTNTQNKSLNHHFQVDSFTACGLVSLRAPMQVYSKDPTA